MTEIHDSTNTIYQTMLFIDIRFSTINIKISSQQILVVLMDKVFASLSYGCGIESLNGQEFFSFFNFRLLVYRTNEMSHDIHPRW